jgi:hypothetical protein
VTRHLPRNANAAIIATQKGFATDDMELHLDSLSAPYTYVSLRIDLAGLPMLLVVLSVAAGQFGGRTASLFYFPPNLSVFLRLSRRGPAHRSSKLKAVGRSVSRMRIGVCAPLAGHRADSALG